MKLSLQFSSALLHQSVPQADLGGYVVQELGEHSEGGPVQLVIVDDEPNNMLYIQ